MSFDYQQRIQTPIEAQPIDKLLQNLSMESVFFTRSHLSSPWAIAMPAMSNCMMFHLVIDGNVTFFSDETAFELQAGDFVLFPQHHGHSLSDGTCTKLTALADLPIQQVTPRFETLDFGGAGQRTQLVCGALLFEHPLAIKLLKVLPAFITIKPRDDASAIVHKVSQLLQSEVQTLAIGAEAVVSRLAELLVIAAMRQHLTQLNNNQLGWLAAMQDPRISKALTLIHHQPDRHWSLEDLAINVGMSRTSFANQFKLLVGNTPMDYLTEWRMSLAFSRLQSSNDNVLAVALEFGYQSEASFSRAFKKVIGKTPSEVRQLASSPH